MKKESLITKIFKIKDIFLLLGIFILCLLLFRQCDNNLNLKSKIELQNMNLDALNDSVRMEKNKAKEDTYIKKILIADKKSLEKLNKDLKDELDKQKGKVIVIKKVVTETKIDTHYINNYLTAYGNNLFSLDWKYDSTFSINNYRKFSGKSFFVIDTINNKVFPGKTRIDQDEIGFSFVTGIREKDKSLEIFVTPKYPGMKITEIDGAFIDPYKSDVLKNIFPNKKWSVGPYIGVGMGAGYGLNGNAIVGPVLNIGLGIQYSWFKF